MAEPYAPALPSQAGAHAQQALLGLRGGRLDADLLHALQQELVLGLQVGHGALQGLDAQHLTETRLARRLAVLCAPAAMTSAVSLAAYGMDDAGRAVPRM